MKKFMQFSIGISLIISACALFMFSIQPAYGERDSRIVSLSDSSLRVMYINIDTINNNYLAYVDLAKSANDSLNTAMETYQENAADLQRRYSRLQEQVAMGLISTTNAMNEENAINKGLDELRFQEERLARLEANAMTANDSISALVAIYFHEYSIAHNIDYVFMYGTGMPIIYANDRLDLTVECVNELNAEYRKQHPERTKPETKKEGK